MSEIHFKKYKKKNTHYHFVRIFIANHHFQRKERKDKTLHIFSLNLKLPLHV